VLLEVDTGSSKPASADLEKATNGEGSWDTMIEEQSLGLQGWMK
jgi:hypothetical protein